MSVATPPGANMTLFPFSDNTLIKQLLKICHYCHHHDMKCLRCFTTNVKEKIMTRQTNSERI